MADDPKESDAAIHAEAIIAAILTAAYMGTVHDVYTPDSTIKEYRSMLNKLRQSRNAGGTFNP